MRAAYGASGTQPLYGVRYHAADDRRSPAGFPAWRANDTARQSQHQAGIGDGDRDWASTRRCSTRGRSSPSRSTRSGSTNLLLQAGVDASRGYNVQWLNGGEFTNQGAEMSFTATPVQLRNGFTWVSTTSFFRNYSVVNSLPVPPFSGGGRNVDPGRPLGLRLREPARSPLPNGSPLQVGDAPAVVHRGSERGGELGTRPASRDSSTGTAAATSTTPTTTTSTSARCGAIRRSAARFVQLTEPNLTPRPAARVIRQAAVALAELHAARQVGQPDRRRSVLECPRRSARPQPVAVVQQGI